MQLQSPQCPTPGVVPTEEGNLPNEVRTVSSSDTDMKNNSDSSANLSFANGHNHLQESLHTSAYHTKFNNTTTTTNNKDAVNHTTPNSSNTTPSRSHVLRSSSRKLLHRCSLGTCCRGNRSSHNSRIGHRNTGSSSNNSSIQLNIPFVETITTHHPYCHEVPDPTKVSGAVPSGWYNNYYYYRHSNDLSEDNNTNDHLRWQANIHNHNNINNYDANSRREVLVRGVQSPLLSSEPPHHLQQQPQALRVQPYYRKRAINYMMTHLQFSGSENDAAIEAVRKRIERLEDQVFSLANTKDQYVHLLSVKLGLIMESLNNCRNTRINRPQNHAQVHPQPACV